MYHLVASARPGTLLFRTHVEAARLFRALADAFPELVAVCVMPDHVHLVLPHADPGGKLGCVMSGYARWRNAQRREHGAVWTPHPTAEELPNEDHRRRTVRYVHLNPCRRGLVRDPLAWPWSSHRDAVGLVAHPIRACARDPEGFHAYVSGDPSAHVAGTPLPVTLWTDATWADARDAASAVFRVPVEEVGQRGEARTAALQAAWYHGVRPVAPLAAHAGVAPRAVRAAVAGVPGRGARIADPALAACVRVLGDPRFAPLPDGDLRKLPAWSPYRGRR